MKIAIIGSGFSVACYAAKVDHEGRIFEKIDYHWIFSRETNRHDKIKVNF